MQEIIAVNTLESFLPQGPAPTLAPAEPDDHAAGATPSTSTSPAACTPGYYVKTEAALLGPLSVEDLSQHADSELWWTDGVHSYGPYPGSEILQSVQRTQQASYSEAVRPALGPDEQHLAALAQEAGTTLHDLVKFCYSSADAPCEPHSTEGGGQLDCKPEDTGSAEAEAREPCRGWRKLSKIKKQRKQKQRTAWLFS